MAEGARMRLYHAFKKMKITEVLLADGQWYRTKEFEETHHRSFEGPVATWLDGEERFVVPFSEIRAMTGADG